MRNNGRIVKDKRKK